jgi:hypothetical protein
MVGRSVLSAVQIEYLEGDSTVARAQEAVGASQIGGGCLYAQLGVRDQNEWAGSLEDSTCKRAILGSGWVLGSQ